MAVSEKKQGDNRYVSYNYRDGKKTVVVYCGKKGKASTEERLRAAKRQHHETRMRRLQDRSRE